MPPNSPKKDSSPNFDAVNIREGVLTERFNIIDKAAKKDLHWWFFVLLMIGMGYVGFERWESNQERVILRSEITEVRNAQMAYLTAKNEAMMAALLNNTRALEANTQTLNRLENRRTE